MREQNNSIFAQLNGGKLLALCAIGAIFVLLVVGNIVMRAPWCDEAYFGEPAYRLSTVGQMASIVVPPSPKDDPKTIGTDRYTFYALPLHLLLQAGWYKLVGFGLIQQRMISLFWGLLALASWWVVLVELGADAQLQVAAIAMTALDYTFVRASSDGRMDMMSAALGTLSLAIFLRLQRRSYTRAVLFASASSAASIFTHPVGGLLSTVALGIVMLWFSQNRFRWWHFMLVGVPYLLFAAAWGAYILQAPHIFKGQFSSISAGRLSAWKQPVGALYREATERWAAPFGFGSGGIKRIKAVILVLYFTALIWSLSRLRSSWSGRAVLPLIALSSLFILCFAESTKAAAYLIHVIPVLTVIAAETLMTYRKTWGFAVLMCTLAVQLAGSIYQIARLEYRHEYAPVITFLKDHGGDVTGVASLGYGLGFNRNLVDDRRLGLYTGRDTRFVVIDGTYRGSYNRYRTEWPTQSRYVAEKLAHRHIVFENPMFTIYEK